MSKPHIGWSDDYAVLEAGTLRFYYGYERFRKMGEGEDAERRWLFEVTRDGKVLMSKTAEELGLKSWESPRLVVLQGIGVWLSEEKE